MDTTDDDVFRENSPVIVDCDVLEAAKENVRPLDSGRRVTALSAILSTPHAKREAKLSATRTRLRMNIEIALEDEEDDPLDAYCSLVYWTVENYPQGHSAESGLLELLEEATRVLKDGRGGKWRMELKYLKLWVLYASYVERPVMIYKFLMVNEIGTAFALLYEEYAAVLEREGQRSAADEIYSLGIARQATPLSRLASRHREFQKRMVSCAPLPTDLPPITNSPATTRRTVLSAVPLPTATPPLSTRAPESRTGGLGGPSQPTPNGRMQVFVDPAGTEAQCAEGNEWSDLGGRKTRIKENVPEVLKMGGTTVRQSGKSKRVASSSETSAAAKFKPFRDEEEATTGPSGCPSTASGSAMKVKKLADVKGASMTEAEALRKDPLKNYIDHVIHHTHFNPINTFPNMPVALADGRQGQRIENYTKFWQKDLNNEDDTGTNNRVDSYTDVVNGYYDGATELYEYGWASSFHFSRFFKGEGFAASLARHEHYLASQMSLRPGMKVLDVGCGVGGPARQIAQFADVNIVGLNNNAFQIQRARKYTKKAGLQDQLQFVQGDFMKLAEQFGENSFDAIYAIEATVHAPTWEGVYGEILKVLKPGGIFGVYEWCMTDKWDPSVPSHKELAHQIEIGNGIPEMRPLRDARRALKTIGFQIEHEEDLAERPDDVPWYYPLEGNIWRAQTWWDYFTVWRLSWSGKFVTHNALRLLEYFRFMPKGTVEVGETLKIACDALARGGQTKLFTPMYLVIARKPVV